MNLSVESYQDPSAFDGLAGEWLPLLRRSAMNTLFLTPAYQSTWWRHLGAGDLLLLAVREQGDLVGLAPLFASQRDEERVLQIVGCVEVSDYLDWIAAPGNEEAVLEAALEFLDSPECPPWQQMDLCNIHQDSPTLKLLPALAEKRGWHVQTEVQEVCPVVDLPDTWDDYLAMLDGKDRHELRRKLRRARAIDELHWTIVGPEDDLNEAVDNFLRLMAKSAREKADFLTDARRDFFRGLAQEMSEAGWLQLSFLTFRGQKLASYFSFVYNNRVLVYNSGFDWEADPNIGSGIVLTGFLIEHAIQEGRAAYDFLRGDERYKYRFGGTDVTVHQVLVEKGR